MATEAIQTIDLKKTFKTKGKRDPVQAVQGVTLSVAQGEIFGFLGPNGAGKTTCQRMMTTLLPIESGRAIVAGFDAQKNPQSVRQHIGYVSQSGGADLPATGRENLTLAGRLYGLRRQEVQAQIKEISHLLDIEDLLDRIVRTYSGGQKRRLEIALGILHKPRILFMDEPTTGLDPQNRANLWNHVRRLKENGMTVFLTTHYLDEADALADRLAIIDQGLIVAEGTPAELKRQISGDVIQMKLKKPVAATFWKELDFVNEIRCTGDEKMTEGSVFLYVDDGAKALPAVFEMLKARNVEIETVSLSEPSLDDVFLKKTGRSLRDTGKEVPQ